MKSGLGYGLTSVAFIAAWGVFAFAFEKMLRLSLKLRFDGPMEALQGMVEFCLEYIVLLATPTVFLTGITGGVFGGWLTEWVAKRWS